MFDFQAWIKVFEVYFRENGTAYNDAADYGVRIDSFPNRTWRVLGIHHLTPEENRGLHNVYVEMLCRQNEREAFRAIHWTWQGRQLHEAAPDVFAGEKPLHELVDIPINLGMVVDVWTNGGEVAAGFSSDHPDERPGNTIGHHSYFVCFQEIGGEDEIEDPPGDSPEDEIVMTIKKSWFDGLSVEDDGFVRIWDRERKRQT